MPKKIPENTKDLIFALHYMGKSQKHIAQKVGISQAGVSYILKSVLG